MQNDISSKFPNEEAAAPPIDSSRTMAALDEISRSICSIQNSISSLTKTRDEYLIHFQQYQSDYEYMQCIYTKMKDSLLNQKHDIPNDPFAISSYTAPNHIRTFDFLIQPPRHPNHNQNVNSGQPNTINDLFPNSKHNAHPIPQPIMPIVQPIDPPLLNDMILQPVEHLQMSLVDLSYQLISTDNNKLNVGLRFALRIPAVLCSVQFDPNGKIIAFSDGRLLHLISAENGALMSSIEIPRSQTKNELHTRTIRFSHDGKLIALSSMASGISIFSTETHKCLGTLNVHSKPVSSILFLKKRSHLVPIAQNASIQTYGYDQMDSTLISGSFDGMLCIWDIPTMSLIKIIPHGRNEVNGQLNREGAIVSLATDCDETFIAVGFMKGVVGIYDTTFSQPMNSFTAHDEYLLSVQMVPGESAIITTSHDKTAKLWGLYGVSSCKKVFSSHKDYVICSSMAHPQIGLVKGNQHTIKENTLMLTGSKDETLKGWNRKSGDELFTIVGHKNTLFEIMHHPSEMSFVSCSGDGLVCLWDYKSPPY